MSYVRIAFIVIVLSSCITSASAQTVVAEDPVKLTFSIGSTSNRSPHAATNGEEWGVAYVRRYNFETLHFLRCDMDGNLIDQHELYRGANDKETYGFPYLTAYPKGWAMTYRKYDAQYVRTLYFSLLNKSGRKTGIDKVIAGDEGVYYLAPIWTGEMFVVFHLRYSDVSSGAVWMSYFDMQGNHVVPDKKVLESADEEYAIDAVVPSSKGFAVFGHIWDGNDFVSAFYCMVDLDGSLLSDIYYLDNQGRPFSPIFAVWNGSGFGVSGLENYGIDNSNYTPMARVLGENGAWKCNPFLHTHEYYDYPSGIAYDGASYISLVVNSRNDTVECAQLNNSMRLVGSTTMIDDSRNTSTANSLYGNGSTAVYFSSSSKALDQNGWNIYFQRLRFPHTGKPVVKYFNGEVHEFNGKQYALFDWLVAGAEKIKFKAKGGRWTLPAEGFHAIEITQKSRFKIVATNGSGNTRAKLKITP